MAKHVPARTPDTRIIHYADPAAEQRHELLYYTAAQLAARQREQRVMYARWLARQTAIAERDRKVRRLMIRVAVVAVPAVLGGVGLAVWAAWQAITSAGAGLLLVVPLVILAVAGLAFGGHRCITIVEHRH